MDARYEIDISDRQGHLALDGPFLHEAVRRVLAAEQVASAEISLAVVDDAAIQRVNREYLRHDRPTDVISFLLNEDIRQSAGEPPRAAGRRIEGEVIVSAETAVRTAGPLGWNPADELLLYVVHGVLHLCGYDDLTDDERPRMRARERDMLTLWGLTPPFADPSGEPVPEDDGEPPGNGMETR